MATTDAQIAALTTAVNNLVAAATTKIGDLNTAVTSTGDNVTAAQAAQTAAEAAAANAYNYQQDAASVVAYQNLAEIVGNLAAAAVAMFVYDTSKDSDGGAWRHRTQGTSCYQETLNTATRGKTRAFPAVALIVAEASTVTVYDATDPTLPTWKVLNIANYPATAAWAYSSIAARDGKILVGLTGTYGGLLVLDFVGDAVTLHRTSASKAYAWNNVAPLVRTSALSANDGDATPLGAAQQDELINDIAVTVLPGAPIDTATGLPFPTIAVASNGGVSVIKDDGSVVNLTDAAYAFSKVDFTDRNTLYLWRNVSSFRLYTEVSIPSASEDISGLPEMREAGTVPALLAAATTGPAALVAGRAAANSLGVTLISPYPSDQAKSMVHYLTSTWISGWMPGDIKGAFLASPDTSSLVAQELVTNGTFDTDVSGWLAYGTTTLSWDASGAIQCVETGGQNGGAYQNLTTVVGKTYRVSVEVISDTANTEVNLTASGLYVESGWTGGARTISLTFKATSTSTTLILFIAPGSTAVFDNASVKLADDDRSVNNNGLIVNGTVTRAPVNTGSELVAYSGFSAANNLQQPYNPALDFGTGDFHVMGWINLVTLGVTRCIASRQDDLGTTGFGTGALFRLEVGAANTPVFGYDPAGGGGALAGPSTLAAGWHFLVGLRRSGTVELYADGKLVASAADSSNLSNANAVLKVGFLDYIPIGLTDFAEGLALVRVGATAPSADQVAKIYRDERRLFEAGAQCTLYGASDAVTALAHDPDTNKLHVGTSAGRSVFDGLVRIANTTTPVATAIAAVDDLVMEA